MSIRVAHSVNIRFILNNPRFKIIDLKAKEIEISVIFAK